MRHMRRGVNLLSLAEFGFFIGPMDFILVSKCYISKN